MNGTTIAGLMIIIVGLGLAVVPVIAQSGGLVGGGNGQKIEYCNMQVSVHARVQDYNNPIPIPGLPSGVKQVVDWDVHANKLSNSCHYKAWWELSVVPSASLVSGEGQVPKPNALIGEGTTTFDVKLFDASKDLVKDVSFVINTPSGTPEKVFDQVVLFKDLPHGTYTIEIWHSWKSDGPAYPYPGQITI